MNTAKQKISDLLALADIKINGSQPWDLIVHNENFYQRVLAQGALGLGESYMDGWWDCQQLDVMITKIIQANIHKKIFSWNLFGDFLLAKIRNSQNRKRAYQVAQEHYDLGNELYQAMLDSEMSYSCAYWQQAANLDQAQSAKLALCCDKLQLKPGARVLDIGCGWGAFARYAASKYHVQVDGITVSQEQVKYNQERNKGLSIDIKLQDYRLLTKEYDAIISIGMFEHVGYKNYQEFMQIVYRCLREGGLFLLHTIGGNTSVYSNDSWTGKYIFPNGMLPSPTQISKSISGLFVLEDWHNFGADYDKTLMAWYQNFQLHWPQIKQLYNERFYRMWNYYLLSCAGSFRARKNQLWQIVLAKGGVSGGYQSIR